MAKIQKRKMRKREVRKVRSKNNESGVILPMVVIFMLFVTITGLAFLNMTVMEHNLAMAEVHKTQAFYLAEGGIEHARVKLGNNWDLTSIDETPLGEGTYMAGIYDTEAGDGDLLYPDDPSHPMYNTKRRIRSTGIVKEVSQIVQVIVIRPPTGDEIKAALEAGGNVTVRGNATISGDLMNDIKAIIAETVDPQGSYTIEPPLPDGISESPECTMETPYLGCFADFFPGYPYEDYFEYVFKMKKDEVKELAQSGKNTYYSTFVRDPEDVAGITWVDDPDGVGSQITSFGWHGEGILIVNGDLTMTGGTFNGILWVIGTLEIGAGNPVINGAVVVESATTADAALKGTLSINYDKDKIDLVLQKIATLPWIEKGTWEQLK